VAEEHGVGLRPFVGQPEPLEPDVIQAPNHEGSAAQDLLIRRAPDNDRVRLCGPESTDAKRDGATAAVRLPRKPLVRIRITLAKTPRSPRGAVIGAAIKDDPVGRL
jgi:hypothetical protein